MKCIKQLIYVVGISLPCVSGHAQPSLHVGYPGYEYCTAATSNLGALMVAKLIVNHNSNNKEFGAFFIAKDGRRYYVSSAPDYGSDSAGGRLMYDALKSAGEKGNDVEVVCSDAGLVSVQTDYEQDE